MQCSSASQLPSLHNINSLTAVQLFTVPAARLCPGKEIKNLAGAGRVADSNILFLSILTGWWRAGPNEQVFFTPKVDVRVDDDDDDDGNECV